MSLYECFESIPDVRNASGLRTPLPALLCMITMAHMSGHSGFRPIATFMKAHKSVFIPMFNLKHPPLGHTQLNKVMNTLNFDEIFTAFHKWMNQFVDIEPGDWLSGDGKSLASTVKDAHGRMQEYVQIVRLFSQKLGIVVRTKSTKSKSGELKAMQALLKELKAKGVLITLDALHCQKKQLK